MDSLVKKAKKGSKKAFMLLVDNMKGQMYKTALVQLGNEQDALDAVQETLIKAFVNINSLRDNRFFKTWVIRILMNECHNIQKYNNKVRPMERELMESAECDSFEHESCIEMNCILDRLDSIYRDVVDLRYNQHLKLAEISQILDIPVGTVKSRLNTAHKLLKKEYRQKEA